MIFKKPQKTLQNRAIHGILGGKILCQKSVLSAMAGHPKKIYTIAELGRIRSKFCGCERKELLFYYESEKREVCSRV